MDKERFFSLTKDIRTGERVRVLFDLLMECIGAQESIKKGEFFEMLKAKIVAEQEAQAELMKAGGLDVKKKRHRKAKEAVEEMDADAYFKEETDNGVSVSD